MIQAYPPSPAPFYSYPLYFYPQFFYIIYLLYFSSWNSNRLGPCVVFVTHKNTRKSHIIKRHNRCESIKRERKQKKKIPGVRWQMYCTSVFLLYNQMVSPQSPFQYRMCGWLDVSKAEVQPDKVYKIYPSSSRFLFRVTKMGEHKQNLTKPRKKKKFYRKKIQLFLKESSFAVDWVKVI